MARVATLADIEAIEAVPLETRALPVDTLSWIRQGAVAVGDRRVALRFFIDGRDYRRSFDFDYGALLGSIQRTANLLHGCGVGPDDVVALLLPNLPETYFALFGAETAGIASPVNPLLEPAMIAEIMNAAGAKVLITLAPTPGSEIWDKAEVVRRQVPTLETVLRVDLAPYLPPLRRALLRLWRVGKMRPDPVSGQRVMDFRRALAPHPAERLVFSRDRSADDVASMFHTGGTTGAPKLAVHTHGNEVHNAWALSEVLDSRPDQVILCGLPLFHVNGVIVTGLAPFGRGQTVVLATPQGYRGGGVLDNFWRIVEHYRLSSFSGVPTVYAALSSVARDGADLSSLEFAGCGAAPMPPALFERFQNDTGVRILEGYGLTEGTCVSSINPVSGESRIGSIGLRLPYQELATVLLDAAGGYRRECATDEVGAVVARGPNIMPGYRQPDHDTSIWIDRGDGGPPWLDTGDLGRIDADGYVWLTGRSKELIIRGGHNIDPALIEQALAAHPAVALAAAIGRPDPVAGELPVVYVTLRVGMAAKEPELLAYAAAHVAERAAVPKHVRIVEALPLTPIGKVFKPALRRAEIERVVAEVAAGAPGAAGLEVTVVDDPRCGDLARVRVTAAPEADPEAVVAAVAAVLGPFAFATDVAAR